jgi:hypothetical protein
VTFRSDGRVDFEAVFLPVFLRAGLAAGLRDAFFVALFFFGVLFFAVLFLGALFFDRLNFDMLFLGRVLALDFFLLAISAVYHWPGKAIRKSKLGRALI